MSDYFTDDLILCNKLGLKDEQVLKNAEEEIVAARMVEVIENPVNGSYDFDMLKSGLSFQDKEDIKSNAEIIAVVTIAALHNCLTQQHKLNY